VRKDPYVLVPHKSIQINMSEVRFFLFDNFFPANEHYVVAYRGLLLWVLVACTSIQTSLSDNTGLFFSFSKKK